MSLPTPQHAFPNSNAWPLSASPKVADHWHEEDLIDHHLDFHDITRLQQPDEDVYRAEQEEIEGRPLDLKGEETEHLTGSTTNHRGMVDAQTTGSPPLARPIFAETLASLSNHPPQSVPISSSVSSSSSPDSSNPAQSHPPNLDLLHSTDDTQNDLICRICFGSCSPEEIEELGRLISPCLCSGSMSVSVLQ